MAEGAEFIRSGRTRRTMQCNVRAGALELLAESYGAPVSAEDVFAYIAAIMAHPAFTTRFATDLVRPGLRPPLTAVDRRAKPGHDRRNRGAFRPAPHPAIAAMPVKLGRTSPSAQQGPLGTNRLSRCLWSEPRGFSR